ncbi:NAD(P)/FAD-dependent oxidoreductase [Candidatus Woesearchaeota archaeon]|nr:NAD(P)/FAD-dependent oxidoreductase [Candidatus Woesearchaeota archaeon]
MAVQNPDVTIVGAGVVGLAVAYELAGKGKYSVLVLEKNRTFGLETSSHSSGIIHSGIHYLPGSNKARLCVEGNRLLYELAQAHQIPHERKGKFVVASDDSEVPKLEELLERGKANGVEGLEIISGEDVSKVEPHIKAVKALSCPSSGVIDQMALMKMFEGGAKSSGANIAYNTKVVGSIEKLHEGYRVSTISAEGTKDSFSFTTKILINCAGLFADRIAEMAGIDIDAAGYRQRFNKGSYYAVSPEKGRMVKKPIYPVPPEAGKGLGIHITTDINGQMLLGPDSEIVAASDVNYINDGSKQRLFHEEVQRYFPALELADIAPDMVGYRPQLKSGQDFIIREESPRGLPGMINLIGIESPGLTSSLAIALHVKSLVGRLA